MLAGLEAVCACMLSHHAGTSYFFFSFFFFCLFRAVPMAYGSSQARGQMGTAAAGLCHSHSNMGSKPHLQPTLQLMAIPDP